MNRTKTFALTFAALTLAALTLIPSRASAQVRTRDWGYREVRPESPRRDWVVRPLVDTAERQSNAFRAYFESHDAKGRLGRYHDNKYLKNQIRMMDESFERLRAKADDHRPGVGKPDLKDALMRARNVDREIDFAEDTRRTIREWSDLRATLNQLADLYNLRGL